MTAPATGVRPITCPACGGSVDVRAAGFTVNLACLHCGSLLDVSRPEVALIQRYTRAATAFAIPLGTRGVLFDETWEIVGAVERQDQLATWQEYLLFNPYLGYRWLVASDGDWQFGTPLADRPQGSAEGAMWRGKAFEQVGPDQTAVAAALAGEFYWRLKVGDAATCTLFRRGTMTLSREVTACEENWTALVQVRAGTVAASFGLTRQREPQAQLQALLQAGDDSVPAPDDLGRMFLLATITAIAALFAMVLLAGPVSTGGSRVQVPVGSQLEPVRVGTITVSRPFQFVTIEADSAEFENRWVDLDYSLVNRTNEQSIDSYGLVEHYTGTDSDGRWSEGSYRGETVLGQVPRGTYDVYVSASAHGWPADPDPTGNWGSAETISVAVQARTGDLPWSMWWTLVAALYAWPLLVLWWRNRDDD